MRLSFIAALATNNVMGAENRLPWRQSADLKRFKALTLGHHYIVGRRTYESVGRPLPGRTNVVVTRDPAWKPPVVATPLASTYGAGNDVEAPLLIVNSIDEAIGVAENAGDQEPFIGGGAEIFRQTLHRADRMYLTRIHAEVAGDTFFPEFDDVAEWQLIDSEHFDADEKNQYPYSFLTYDRLGVRSEFDPHCALGG
jgi:dihydrofolate reductase